MIDVQRHFVFPTHAVPPAGPLIGGEAWSLKSGHATLRGVHYPPEDGSSDALILGFGGNAWNGQDVGEYLRRLFPRADIVAFHYRGYHPSTGTPSADGLIEDAPKVYDYAISKLKPRRVFAVGFSIGSGIAATLSAVRKLDGIILVTPFDSLKAVAQAAMPFLPVGMFFGHEIAAAQAVEGGTTPVAIIAGSCDEIVPSARTDALRTRVPNLVYDTTIKGAGHNDIYARSAFQQAMDEALLALGGAP